MACKRDSSGIIVGRVKKDLLVTHVVIPYNMGKESPGDEMKRDHMYLSFYGDSSGQIGR